MLLALDLATVTGFALGDLNGIKVSGSRQFPKTGNDIGWFADAFRTWLTTGLKRHKPEKVVYEQPIIHGDETTLATCRKLYGLAWQTELTCRDLKKAGVLRREFVVEEVNIGDWRTHFLGRGYPRERNACKAAVKQMCRVRGFLFEDDNEAEAIAILDYALACASPASAIRATPLFANDGPRPQEKISVTALRAGEAAARR
jgi:hypothetical protein